MLYPPWTSAGHIQGEVEEVKRMLHGKVERHELHAISSRMDHLECAMRDISASLDGIRAELQAIRENQVEQQST